MEDSKIIREKMRSEFFELLSKSASYSKDEIILACTKQLSRILGIHFTGLYLYDEWNRKYHLKTKCDNETLTIPSFMMNIDKYTESIAKKTMKKPFINGSTIIQDHPQEIHTSIIKLAPNNEYLILLSEAKGLTEEILFTIKEEIESVLHFVNHYYGEQASRAQNLFLINLSSFLQSTVSYTDVLTKISESLNKFYPTYAHHILLSHDYESTSTLPVKSMDFNDDITKEISTKAFTTGKVQIDRKSDNKHACVYVPLSGNQGVYGVIQIIMPKNNFFPDKEIEFIIQFSGIAGRAIERAILYRSSSHLIADLNLINETTHELNSNLELSELITIFKNKVFNICGAKDVGFIHYNDESTEKYDVLSGSSSFYKTEKGLLFLKHIEQQLKKDLNYIFSIDYTEQYSDLPYRSVIAIPMIHTNHNLGFIVLLHEESSYFTFENFKLIQSLTRHSALAFSNTVLKTKLEAVVITDDLTKLYSRKHLDEMLQKHMEKDDKGTLILFDIFKKINDTYGHYIGDEVLIQVADIIRSNIGLGDISARWGGEEFAVYLPQADLESGVQLAEKIRQQAVSITEPKVSFSCGVSTWTNKHMDTVKDVFIRADQSLYKAKNTGKNCVITEAHLPLCL